MVDSSFHVSTYPSLDERLVILRAADTVDAVFFRIERYNVLVDTPASPALCRQALARLVRHMAVRPLLPTNSHKH